MSKRDLEPVHIDYDYYDHKNDMSQNIIFFMSKQTDGHPDDETLLPLTDTYKPNGAK